ncbi:glycosyl transferase [Pedobacter psychrophilus]|uniref:Glycosyl transferase n=1 Tax=Pedobacter psychrophilus TaxID=1826909 RepID=A0A179DMI6_9SPHI|nr:glycosyltransferase family 4 protein [Pedobacter psychrophilus]OAQ42134.1 glycosyl transferase [Pedobacter psychrophilus]
MKVAILSPVAWRTPPVHYGPWEQMASNLAENLVKLGIDVTLFATGDSFTSGKLNSVILKGYETEKGQDAKVLECLHISNLIENADQFDIIHNHFDFLPLTYSKLIKTPIITTIHGFSSDKIIPVYQKYNDHTYYVSISNSDRSDKLKYLATVYNGLNTEEFTFNPSPKDQLLFFGRIHPDKGTAEAIAIAKKTNKKLIIAGIIQDEGYFEREIKPHLNEDVQFIGSAGPQKRNELMGESLALLHPINFNEPFGLSVAEAMMCGTPVIAFNRGSMPELIENNKNGFLVDNVEKAVDAIDKTSSIDRKKCSELAKNRFSAKTMASEYLKLYHQILNQ